MEASSTPLAALATPALILDRDALERNCRRMSARAAALGVRLRPHLKTAKSIEVARLATAGGFAGVTVSTVAEAAYLDAHGVDDILYAVGAHPSKLPGLAALSARVTLVISDAEMAPALDDEARRLSRVFPVLVEIDTGAGRAGLLPEDAAVIEVARALAAASHLRLEGVMTHAGQSYRAKGEAEIAGVAERERAGAVRAASRMREAGFEAPVVSVGSTPTALHARHLEGVTELRAGVYTLFDLDQHGLGLCALEDIAASVLASVIGHNRHTGRILVDAGALALSKDLSAANRGAGVGYGLVVEEAANTPVGGLAVTETYQEHGCIAVRSEADFARLPVGARVRILPNHACMTVAPYDRYHLRDRPGGPVVETWGKATGW